MLDVPQVPIDILEATWAEIDDWHHQDTAAPWWRWYWNDRPGWSATYRGRSHPLLPHNVVLIAPETNAMGVDVTSFGEPSYAASAPLSGLIA